MHPGPWFIATLPSALLNVSFILSLRGLCNPPPDSLLVTSHKTAKWLQEFQSSVLTSYSSEEKRASPQASSVERRMNFSLLEDLSNYLLTSVFPWQLDLPWTNCWDQEMGFIDWFKAISPFSLTPTAKDGSVLPQVIGTVVAKGWVTMLGSWQ